MSLNNEDLNLITQLRHTLHSEPELSEKEFSTSERIADFLAHTHPDLLLKHLGHMKTGICAIYNSNKPGPQILLRCELDALPIEEKNEFAHKSKHSGVSHKCGHDGHMATMCLVAKLLGENRPQRGSVGLIFQPAEENGEGAKAIIEDKEFQKHVHPDFVFGFHNIPKYKKHQILIRSGIFSSASAGFIIKLTGTSTHSSYPENGKAPSLAVSQLIAQINTISKTQSFDDNVVTTVSFAQLGNADLGPNFGTAPGEATVMGIIRAFNDHDFNKLKQSIHDLSAKASESQELDYDISWHEEYAVTVNDQHCTDVLEKTCLKNNFEVLKLEEPFRWSEDFSYFSKAYKSCFFGIGSGVEQPQLHNEYYDYPDDLIPTGAKIYKCIVDEILNNEEDVDVRNR